MQKSLHEFYGDLVHKYGWKHVAPFLNALPAIEAEIQKRELTAFTSHEMLRVTAHAVRYEWFDDDVLSIIPDRSGVARVIFQNKEDRTKVTVGDFVEKGGSAVAYEELVSTIIPYLEGLAQKKR